MDIRSCTDCNASLICAATPSTRQFINKIRPHLLSTYIRQAMTKYSGFKEPTAGQKSWPMKKIGSGKGKSQYVMSDTALARDDSASQIYESRPESYEHSWEAQDGS
jgi:hypothetical protein